jgi:molybdopterin converting factor small subunit
MARVSAVAQSVRQLTGGLDHFEVEAASVRELLAALEQRFPGLGRLASTEMAIAIDGDIHHDALGEALAPDSEVVLIPRIAGG